MVCKRCQIQFPSPNLFLRHLKAHLNNNENIFCPLKGCEKTFHLYSSYTSHLSRCHNKTPNTFDGYFDLQDENLDNVNSSFEHSIHTYNNSNENYDEHSGTNTIDQQTINKHIALLMLKFKEIYMLPQSTI